MIGRSYLSSSHSSRVPPPPCSTAFSRKSVDYTNINLKNPRSHSTAGEAICGSVRSQTELTMVVMGASKVGKSALINQFLHRVFSSEYKETVDDMHWIEYDTSFINSQFQSGTMKEHKSQPDASAMIVGLFLLKIIDTSGSREFIGMRKLYEEQGDAFIIVVSIDDPQSLEEAKMIRKEIDERNQKNAPVIIVLNKIDLRNQSDETSWREFRVMAEQTYGFAASSDSIFAESTATKYDSVAEIFQRILQLHSSVPPTVGLKYRRKSVPSVSVTLTNFPSPKEMALKRRADNEPQHPRMPRLSTFSDNSEELSEEEQEQTTTRHKGPSCVIC